MSTQPATDSMRRAILKLVSDHEIARISAAESRRFVEGDEYVDLRHPEKGVLKVRSTPPKRSGNLLPRSAVREKTWAAIVAEIAR